MQPFAAGESENFIKRSFVATGLMSETCIGCGTCVERCQMEAIHLAEDKASLDLNRCIGCGLCVSTCPTGSFALERKPAAEQCHVPKDILEIQMNLAKVRGKLTLGKLIGSRSNQSRPLTTGNKVASGGRDLPRNRNSRSSCVLGACPAHGGLL